MSEDWEKSIKSYETARRMFKLEDTAKVENSKRDGMYDEELKTVYCGRGKSREESGRLIEAAADFEQVLILRPRPNKLFKIQASGYILTGNREKKKLLKPQRILM